MSPSRTLLVLLCAGAALGAHTHQRHKTRRRVKTVHSHDPDCTTILMGKRSMNAITMPPKVVTEAVNVVQIPDLGGEVSGVAVEVCNQWRNGRPIVLPPPSGFSPVQVYSGAEDAWNHTEMSVRVTQYIGKTKHDGQFLPAEDNVIFNDNDIYSYLYTHGNNVIDV